MDERKPENGVHQTEADHAANLKELGYGE